MQVGDLVYWYNSLTLLGIVLEVNKPLENADFQSCRVQWANGIITHRIVSTYLGLLQTSETT